MTTADRWFRGVSLRKSIAIVALTAPAIVGVTGAAHAVGPASVASSSTASASGAASARGEIRLASARIAAAGIGTASGIGTAPGSATAPSVPGHIGESRVGISALLSALKAIPGLWSTFSKAVKKAYAAFVPLWNQIKKVLGVIGTLISAWDIWKYFH